MHFVEVAALYFWAGSPSSLHGYFQRAQLLAAALLLENGFACGMLQSLRSAARPLQDLTLWIWFWRRMTRA